MATPKEMDVSGGLMSSGSRLASPEPSGKDDEIYHQAKKELQEALDRENQPHRE